MISDTDVELRVSRSKFARFDRGVISDAYSSEVFTVSCFSLLAAFSCLVTVSTALLTPFIDLAASSNSLSDRPDSLASRSIACLIFFFASDAISLRSIVMSEEDLIFISDIVELRYRDRNSVRFSRGVRSKISVPRRFNVFKFVKFSRGLRSDTDVNPRLSVSKFVRCARGLSSDISVDSRYNRFKFVRCARGVISNTSAPRKFSVSKFVKFSRGVRSKISVPRRYNRFKFARCARGLRSDTNVSLRFSVSKFARCAKGLSSDVSVDSRYNRFKFVRCARGVISNTSAPRKFSVSKFIKFFRGVRSKTSMLRRYSVFKFVANSSPVRLLISYLRVSSFVKVAISAWGISAPGALPRTFSISPRSTASGIFTLIFINNFL